MSAQGQVEFRVGLASCGGDDDDSGSNGGDDTAASSDDGGDDGGTSDGGGDDAAGGGTDASSTDAGGDDFPIPAPDGLVLDVLVSSGINIGGQRQLKHRRAVALWDAVE